MVDHALTNGITRLTGVVEAAFLAQILRMGWRCTTPAPPRRFGAAALGAFIAQIDTDTPALLAEGGIYSAAVEGEPTLETVHDAACWKCRREPRRKGLHPVAGYRGRKKKRLN